MNLFVSDYDGTFNRNSEECLKASVKLKSLLEEYYFMLSSGRLYNSLLEEIRKYDIAVNYFSCANGNSLYNSKGEILFYIPLEKNRLSEIIQYNKLLEDISFYDFYSNLTSNEKNILECVIKIKNDEHMLSARKQIIHTLYHSEVLDYCSNPYDKSEIHIFNNSKKTPTIEYILKKENIKDVIVIGDGINDVEMIKKYNGYYLNTLSTHFNSEQGYDNILDFMDEIIKKKKVNKICKHI